VVDFYIGGVILMLILMLLFWRAVRGPCCRRWPS
jgi:hypothetical protein